MSARKETTLRRRPCRLSAIAGLLLSSALACGMAVAGASARAAAPQAGLSAQATAVSVS